MNKWKLFKTFLHDVWSFYHNSDKAYSLMVDEYLRKHLCDNPKYRDNPKRLSRYEFQVYSQNGEDGVVEEIFNRIGTTNKFFVEFGVGTGEKGLENNTSYLLVKGWKGVWFDSDIGFKPPKHSRLTYRNTTITPLNIEAMLGEHLVPEELDFLCIDIDGNDYRVWKNVSRWKPMVLMIEYNALFPPEVEWVMPHSQHSQKHSQYFGASLKSYELLGKSKGYSLVGCDFTGTNAFFVRNDLIKDKFYSPFTAENHYEPIRYFLHHKNGVWRILNE